MSHVERTIRIHAPLGSVYAQAHDPKHWSDWYVGVSSEVDLDAQSASGEHRHVMVGAPFPLTQRVVEDRLGRKEARWKAKAEAPPEEFELTSSCKLVMLASDSEWIYSGADGETEVRVVLDFSVPTDFVRDARDRTVIESIEANCVERSLENLRKLCEVSH